MNQQVKETLDPKLQVRLEKMEKRTKRVEHMVLHALHHIELTISLLSLLVLVITLAVEVVNMVAIPGYFKDVTTYLHHILTIVVGLEFVRMLVDTTPANVLEVLTLAITRHVILSHDDPVSNLISVICVAGLFAIRRYLIRSSELKAEMVEND